MRYIRFLKVPKFQGSSIRSVITVTSDLGESFLAANAILLATLRSVDDGDTIILRQTLKWHSGSRALPVSFDIGGLELERPVRLHVSLATESDHLGWDKDGINLPSILSVWSDTLNPSRGLYETNRLVERRFEFSRNRTLSIWEETGESIARHLWDGSIALTTYVDQIVTAQAEKLQLLGDCEDSATVKKLSIIELGCGCGMVGISLAQIIPDCKVYLTDVLEAEEIAERNIAAARLAPLSTAEFVALDWEAPLPARIRDTSFDIIVVSECTYNTDTIPSLVETLSAINKHSPEALLLIATKVRHSSEYMFFELMRKTDFVKASHTKLLLPKAHESEVDTEEVDVYIFRHRAGAQALETLSNFLL